MCFYCLFCCIAEFNNMRGPIPATFKCVGLAAHRVASCTCMHGPRHGCLPEKFKLGAYHHGRHHHAAWDDNVAFVLRATSWQ